MVWTLFRQQQQCGAQVRRPRQPGESAQPAQQEQSTLSETELEQDERGEDAEQTVDPQAEQALGERDGREGESDDDGRLDRND